MHWKFRQWKDGQTNEHPKINEPYGDTIRKRIGIYFGGAANVWFPRQTDKGTRIDTGVNLSGMTSDTVENTMVLDFNTPGEIQVIDTLNKNTVARFTANEALFNKASVKGTHPLSGLINQIINGNINILRNFNSSQYSVNSNTLNSLVAPNWLLWCSKVNGGALTAFIDSVDVPPGGGNSIKVVVNQPCYSGGLRTFVHSVQPFVGKKCTFSTAVKGPLNSTAKYRILTDKAVIGILVIKGTGKWERYSFSVDFDKNPMASGSTVIAVEPIYAPTYGPTTDPWRAGATQMNFGMAPQDLEIRSFEAEKSLLKSLYVAVRRYVQTTDYPSWDLLNGNIVVETTDSEITATDIDNTGAVLHGPAGSTVPIKTGVTAYRLPIVSL